MPIAKHTFMTILTSKEPGNSKDGEYTYGQVCMLTCYADVMEVRSDIGS